MPEDHDSQTASFFDHRATTLSAKYSANAQFAERYLVIQDLIARHCPDPKAGQTCFDIGCGPGIMTARIAAMGFNVVGVDFSREMLKQARARATEAKVSRNTSWIQSSVPLDNSLIAPYRERIDLIICSSVLEYLDRWQPALRQFSELLQPRGIAIVTVPNHRSYFRLLERMIKMTPLAEYTYLKPHRHQIPLEPFRTELSRCQFRVLESRPFALPREFLTRLLGDRRPAWIATMIAFAMQRSPVSSS
jgi:2-polyprenyl-3-methyl-5-hydroxy-6-metoxy-1,4-benzoquinol methylase